MDDDHVLLLQMFDVFLKFVSCKYISQTTLLVQKRVYAKPSSYRYTMYNVICFVRRFVGSLAEHFCLLLHFIAHNKFIYLFIYYGVFFFIRSFSIRSVMPLQLLLLLLLLFLSLSSFIFYCIPNNMRTLSSFISIVWQFIRCSSKSDSIAYANLHVMNIANRPFFSRRR